MREKIVLIDGHSILNRAFFAMPLALTDSDGLHTGAVYGFLNILFKVLDEEKPEYLTVTFDVHAPTFRHEMYAQYKGTRRPMAEELKEQVPVIKEVLKAMDISTVEKAGLEADDLLGTISRICEEKGMDVSIVSGDRDILQLASEHIKVRIPRTKQGRTDVEDYLAADVKEKIGVSPMEFIDMKALMGDPSDNIPGVPGIGEKTAAKIIQEYGSIENAHEHASEIKPPRAGKNLGQYWDQAVLSKKLATIERYADTGFNIEAARYKDPYTKEAREYFIKLNFKSFLDRFDIKAENKAENYFTQVKGKEEAQKVFEKAAEAKTVGAAFALDAENVLPLFAHDSGYGGAAVAFGEKDIYYMAVGGSLDIGYLAGEISKLADKVPVFSMFDIKKYLPVIDIRNEEDCFDASIAAYLLDPLKSGYGYEDVAREYLGLVTDDKADGATKACYEAYAALKATDILSGKLKESGMYGLFKKIEMPLVFTLYGMEKEGVRVEANALKEYGERLGKQILILEKEIYEDAGEVFNINSPKQLGNVLFEHLRLPYGKKTKTGYSTAADVLERLSEEYPIVSKILQFRQLSKLKSTYADGLSSFIGEDGRIHGKFIQTGTATGRISSAEPNLQNIPVRVELGKQIRKVFVPKEGCVFLDADYSQIELRVLAHCSEDKNLIEAYRHSEDIHRITASQVFHTPFDEVTPQQRSDAKAVNFGIVYGISSFGLSQGLSITRKEAEKYIESYFRTYPGIKTFLDGCVSSANEKGYAETIFGRRRPVPELKAPKFQTRKFGERVAMNAPIQGTAADIIKIAMVGIDRELKERNFKSRMLIQVHDELLLEVYKDELDDVKELLKRRMETAAKLSVPLIAQMHTGENWYEAK